MKLAAYQWKQQQHIGILVHGMLYSFTMFSRKENPNDMAQFLAEGGLQWAKQIEADIVSGRAPRPAESVCPLEEVHLRPPVSKPEKIICLGLNYRDHALEAGMDIPPEPVFFAKYNNSLNGPYDPVPLPPISDQVDFEAELAVVVGQRGKYISEERAMDYVAGYMVFNDISARDLQFRTGQWTHGKSCDGFAPCGPFLVTCEEVPDPHRLPISLSLNGIVMQNSNTLNLIFRVPFLLAYLSKLFTLSPGDIISTGTPPGVGFARQPPVRLKAGDELVTRIEGIGQLVNHITKE
jgi:2-keto-4-pentenoate hydratase/2-oxohepta-3-ene-1,7-dioic acid hydratase in catechol pathway